LQKGFNPEQIIELTPREKAFYLASMVWYNEKKIPTEE
jgi:hypothetical protein